MPGAAGDGEPDTPKTGEAHLYAAAGSETRALSREPRASPWLPASGPRQHDRVGNLPNQGSRTLMQSTAGTNRDAMRPHNLGAILRHLHRDGALSRATLTARMGLTRGSIGGLLAELETLGAVTIAPDPEPRLTGGRPSPRVRPDKKCVQVLGAESEPTTSVLSVWDSGATSWRVRRARPRGRTSRTR